MDQKEKRDPMATVTLRVKRARRVCGNRARRALVAEKVAARRLARRVAAGEVRLAVQDWDAFVFDARPRFTERDVI
jgi:hypothetical protein